MLNCNWSSCLPSVLIVCISIILLNILILIIFYIYLMYDTYKYYSDDLKSWRDTQIQKIYDTPLPSS